MDVLAEYRELFGQIAITRVRLLITLTWRYAPVRPRMEGMRTTATQHHIHPAGGSDEHVAQLIGALDEVLSQITQKA